MKPSRYLFLFVLGAMLLQHAPLLAQSVVNREYQLKAVFTWRFSRYVTWPADNGHAGNDQFVIGVLGPNPFGSTLKQIAASQKVDGKHIVVKHFAAPSDYEPCHILFVSRRIVAGANGRPEDRLKAISQKTAGQPVLIVSESPNFARRGANINLTVRNNLINLEINKQNAQLRGLKLSSQLLRLSIVSLVQSE